MQSKDSKTLLRSTANQVKWWAYAAWTLPFVALVILGVEYVFNWTTFYEKSIMIMGVVFFSISVYWWWWALYKIKQMIDQLSITQEKIDQVKHAIVKTRKVIEQDVSDRQR